MQAVYLRRVKAIPLSSHTWCFIHKRDLFSQINGKAKDCLEEILTRKLMQVCLKSTNKNQHNQLSKGKFWIGQVLHSHYYQQLTCLQTFHYGVKMRRVWIDDKELAGLFNAPSMIKSIHQPPYSCFTTHNFNMAVTGLKTNKIKR